MNLEDLSIESVIASLKPNPENPYRRLIRYVKWIEPARLPFLFHTSGRERDVLKPIACQSFDYLLNDKLIPVTYLLPFLHVNRVRKNSDLPSLHRTEAIEKYGFGYSYLELKLGGLRPRIRMGSSMLDQWLLASINTGLVFEVGVTEINDQTKDTTNLREFVSLADMPVIDSHQFKTPSPIGVAMGGLETHYQGSIVDPKFVGYHSLSEYLSTLKQSSPQKIALEEIAQNLVNIENPEQVLHGIFTQLITENEKAKHRFFLPKKRFFISLQGT